MDKIKSLFQHAMMISFGIIVGLALQGIIYHTASDDIVLEWYHPLTIIVAGILCALPSLILAPDREVSRRQYRVRIVLHCIVLFIAVMVMGYLFHWYSQFDGAIFIACDFFAIYAFVWGASTWLGLANQRQINEVLDQIRDEE